MRGTVVCCSKRNSICRELPAPWGLEDLGAAQANSHEQELRLGS